MAEPCNPGNVRVYGPGVESITRNEPTHFTVDCRQAGPGNVGISVRDEAGRDVPMDTKDMRDGTFNVAYTPTTAGPTYTVQVFFENTEVPRSPFKVPVKPNVDMSRVRVDGLPSSKYSKILKYIYSRYELLITNIKRAQMHSISDIITL